MIYPKWWSRPWQFKEIPNEAKQMSMQRLEANQMPNRERKNYAKSSFNKLINYRTQRFLTRRYNNELHFRCLEVIKETIWLLIKTVNTSNLKNDDCKISLFTLTLITTSERIKGIKDSSVQFSYIFRFSFVFRDLSYQRNETIPQSSVQATSSSCSLHSPFDKNR